MLCTNHAPPVPPPARPPRSYKWYRSFEAQHFPDPMGVRARLERWTLGLYPTGGLDALARGEGSMSSRWLRACRWRKPRSSLLLHGVPCSLTPTASCALTLTRSPQVGDGCV